MPIFTRLRQWLFRFGHDEQIPIVLTQRRIFILPTRTGVLFCVVLGVPGETELDHRAFIVAPRKGSAELLGQGVHQFCA